MPRQRALAILTFLTMKKILLLSAYLFFFLSTNAQKDTTFNRLINSFPGALSIFNIIKFDSKYYLFYSQYKNSIQNYGVIKLDSSFSIIDSTNISYKTTIFNKGKGFDVNKQDSSFISAGTIHYNPSNSNKENGYLVKFDKNLDTLWTLQIAHPDTAYADTAATPWVALRDVKVTPSGDYIVVGNYN
jgi:hypothetical protein